MSSQHKETALLPDTSITQQKIPHLDASVHCRMPRTAYADPTNTLPAKIHHLALLVNAVTSRLSACLSLDNLLRQTARHTKASSDFLARAEAYHTSLQLSRKSLESFSELVAVQLRLLPLSMKYINDPENAVMEGAYASLIFAARESCQIPALLRELAQTQRKLEEEDEVRLWRGWPSCFARDELEFLCETLVNARDSGGESNVGWSCAWEKMVDDEWCEDFRDADVGWRTG